MIFPKRKPMHAALHEKIDLEDLAWPVTYTYFVDAPWGPTQQHLTVNVPGLVDNIPATQRLGVVLWGVSTAPAVVGDVSCSVMFCTIWKGAGMPIPVAIPTLRGNRIGPAASRENTPQLVLLTGHGDKDGRRRFFLPGAPRDWVEGGLLTTEGWEQLLPHATGCMLGMASPELGSGIEWMTLYPDTVEPKPTNLLGVAFRRVTHCRVVQHTDKAPEPSGIGSLP